MTKEPRRLNSGSRRWSIVLAGGPGTSGPPVTGLRACSSPSVVVAATPRRPTRCSRVRFAACAMLRRMRCRGGWSGMAIGLVLCRCRPVCHRAASGIARATPLTATRAYRASPRSVSGVETTSKLTVESGGSGSRQLRLASKAAARITGADDDPRPVHSIAYFNAGDSQSYRCSGGVRTGDLEPAGFDVDEAVVVGNDDASSGDLVGQAVTERYQLGAQGGDLALEGGDAMLELAHRYLPGVDGRPLGPHRADPRSVIPTLRSVARRYIDPRRHGRSGRPRCTASRLGYLRDSDHVLDVTYGSGGFWTDWRPASLVASDIDPDRSRSASPSTTRRSRIPTPRSTWPSWIRRTSSTAHRPAGARALSTSATGLPRTRAGRDRHAEIAPALPTAST